ncbi:MAG: DUF1501 domain-containing protein [Gaiellaceae bacterium]
MDARKDTDLQALHCADCARADNRETDLAPSQMMPLPGEALVGFPDGTPEERGFSRRSLLKGGAAGLASVYAATKLDWGSVWEEVAANAGTPMQKSLVLLYLNGGNDGANVTIPIDPAANMYPRYVNDARPQLFRQNTGQADTPTAGGRVGTKVMPGTGNGLAFANVCVSQAGGGDNGDIHGFDTLYGDGTGGPGSDLAVFSAVGYPNSTRSHFTGRDIWFRADPTGNSQTGWMGRWLDANGSQTNPLQAVTIGSDLSKEIRTASAPVSALQSLQGVGFDVPGVSNNDPNAEVSTLAGVPVGNAANEALLRSRGMYGLTVDVAARLDALQNNGSGVAYPNSSLSNRLQLAATLLGAGLGTRVITISWGSFDNHGNMLNSHDPQLSVLSRALAAFKADLTARGIEQNVATLVFSEFGRQIYENDSMGTDHGDAGLMMVSGSAVRGGYAGQFPGIQEESTSDAIQMVTDFRTVYQQLIAEWMGGDPGPALPGGPFAGIDRFDAAPDTLFA